jgi:abortive infection bacteriophage resistance protein
MGKFSVIYHEYGHQADCEWSSIVVCDPSTLTSNLTKHQYIRLSNYYLSQMDITVSEHDLYVNLLFSIKQEIQQKQYDLGKYVNTSLLQLYRNIGKRLDEQISS